MLTRANREPFIGEFGLEADGLCITFFCEKKLQRCVAGLVSADATSVLNVGLGLGYSHIRFTELGVSNLKTIEKNLDIIKMFTRSNEAAPRSRDILHMDFSAFLSLDRLKDFDAIYLDILAGDSYLLGPSELRSEIEKLFEQVDCVGFRGKAYILTFQTKPFIEQCEPTEGFENILTMPLPQLGDDKKPYVGVLYRKLFEK